MVAPVIPHWVTVTVHGQTEDGEQWANVLSYSSTPDITNDTMAITVADSFATNVIPHFQAAMSNTCTINDVTVTTHYPSGEQHQGVHLFNPPIIGTVSEDMAPANACGLISWRCGRVGRSFRGRTYVAGVPETSTVGDYFNGGQLVRLGNLATEIYNWLGPAAINLILSIASRKRLELNEVTAFLIDAWVNSQRDRLPKHKRHHKKKTGSEA